MAAPALLAQKQHRPALVADDDVGFAVAVGIFGDDLGADAAVGVDQVGFEVRLAGLVADQFEPIQHGIAFGVGVAVGAVRPVALAGEDVFHAVAVHVDQ